MDQSKKETFHRRLLKERDRLLQDIHGSDESVVQKQREGDELSHLPTHPADHDAEGLDAELTFDATLRDELRAVEEALDRIRNDDFGRCQRCGKDIAVARLEALPFTPYCIRCEREEEAEQAAEAAG